MDFQPGSILRKDSFYMTCHGKEQKPELKNFSGNWTGNCMALPLSKTVTNKLIRLHLLFGCLDFWLFSSRKHLKKDQTQMKSAGTAALWHTRKLKQACLFHTYIHFRSAAMLKKNYSFPFSCHMRLNLTSCHTHILLFQKACNRYNESISKNCKGQRILNMPNYNELHFGHLVLFLVNSATKLCQTQIIFQVNAILSIK